MTVALKSIHIEGFKKFRKFDMEFNPKVNILVGENEAGKTAILEAIKLVLNQTYRFADKSYLQDLFNKDIVKQFKDNPQEENLPMAFYGSSSRKARTSRIHQRITSNGNTMS